LQPTIVQAICRCGAVGRAASPRCRCGCAVLTVVATCRDFVGVFSCAAVGQIVSAPMASISPHNLLIFWGMADLPSRARRTNVPIAWWLRRIGFRCGSLPRDLTVGQDALGRDQWNKDKRMSEADHRCESCGMSIGAGRYCAYCTDESGKLQDFETRLERMVAWTMRRNSELNRAEAEQQTIAYMAGMPAWRDHPNVIAKLGRSDP